LNATTQSSELSQSGARYSRTILVKDSEPVIDGEKAFITSDAVDKESEKGVGPSAFEGTENPFITRVFDINTTEIAQLGLKDAFIEVDSYILGLVRQRQWVDNESSYRRVLTELKQNLGIDESLVSLIALERLSKGVKLLKLQNMHRRREAQIQKQLQKLNKK
jgi:hypothetical protein